MTEQALRPDEPTWLHNHRSTAAQALDQLDQPNHFKYGLSLIVPLFGLNIDDATPNDTHAISIDHDGTAHTGRIADMGRDHYLTLCAADEDYFTTHHVANRNTDVVIRIPEGTDAGTITLDLPYDNATIAHIIVIAEANSTATIVERSTTQPYYANTIVEAFVHDNATLRYEAIQDLNDSWHFSTKRGHVAQNAQLDWFTGTLGGTLSNVEISTELAGRGATTYNRGIFFGRGDQTFNIENNAIHTAPDTYSDMTNKGIVTDESTSIYRGLVKINEPGRNSNGYQTQDTLILSDDAEADAVPNLEINNNDVQCSHGATIGRVDDESIYYLTSRGLSEQQATREIVKGFLGDMVDNVTSDNLQHTINQRVEERL
jgi:Fe-S cluster assembly protein SufD